MTVIVRYIPAFFVLPLMDKIPPGFIDKYKINKKTEKSRFPE